ncbi:type VII toxin-antitoxin system HepT family RNase toxin [Litorilinea aerophila]|uniref:DUF86 domain-containing protein n=1 Tax=Litorilinea aerophila TaxID=1204385 RepID=A0A540VCY9_9CHLR
MENSSVDLTPITQRLSVIATALAALREIQKLSREEFVADYFFHTAAERSLQVAIQAALDVGSILLAAHSRKVPNTYAEIFPALSEIGVLPPEHAQKLVNMAKLRNVLVHMYLEVDLGLPTPPMPDRQPSALPAALGSSWRA